MRQRLRSHLSYANVMSTLGVFLILGGGVAYAANTVFSSDIVDGQVKTADLANGAVAVAKLADGAITGDKVKDGALQGRDVLDNSLRGVDIDESTLSNVGGGGAAGGDLTGSYPNPQIAADAVGGTEVADSAIGSSEVDNGSIYALDVADSAIGSSEVADGSIQDGDLAASARGARAFALVEGYSSCGDPVAFCTLLRSKRVAFAAHVAEGKFCVGVNGINATDPTSLALVNPTFTAVPDFAYWWGAVGSNAACAEAEFEIYTGRIGSGLQDTNFTIVIP